MSIVLFKEITTEEILENLEVEGKKYEGLYVDMNNQVERKYVKDNAMLITDLLKRIDRARIDKTKAYKNSVESEAKSISSRLEEANKPFTLLIDAHKAERKTILDKQKADEERAALIIRIADDHEMGVLMNSEHDRLLESNRIEQERLQKQHDEQVSANAKAEAAQELIDEKARSEKEKADLEQKVLDSAAQERKRLERIKADEEEQTAARERNVEHKRKVNIEILKAICKECCFSEDEAKEIIKAIASRKIPNVAINY